MLAGDGLDRAQEAVGRHHVAGGALDRLDDDGRDLARRLVADDVAQVVGARDTAVRIAKPERAAVAVGVRGQILAGQERSQVMLEVAPEEPEHATGLAVEPTPEADDLVLARRRLCQPERRLHRLGAAGEHLDARESRRRQRGEQIEEAGSRLRREAAEGQPLHLLLERLDVVRVAVADAADADAGDEVDVLVTVLVVERETAAPRHGEPGVLRERLEPRRHVAPLLRDDPTRSRTRLALFHHRPARKRSARWAPMATAASSR